MAKTSPHPRAGAQRGDDADVATEYFALKEISQSLGPVGCWRIRSSLQAAGINLSEATAGRLLRQFDVRGFTQAVGSKGRLLTEKGKRRLTEHEQTRARRSAQHELWQAVHVERIEDILDVLGARRLIEAEAARLAALNASDEEVVELERAVAAHIAEVRAGRRAADLNRAIHKLVAQASKSHVLQAVANFILEDNHLLQVQTRIQRQAGAEGLAPEEHLVIVQAIKHRQPERAAEAMRAHVDRIVRVMRAYGDAAGQPAASRELGAGV
ncbi:MAG: FCD domain-containing protein [Chloroflexi bacterium]|nr:FCD domain-containing protein [Chloroflexota bacterium]